jgi:phenylacetate-coenzyme A ligase PaaK-like adenylate-forming protein
VHKSKKHFQDDESIYSFIPVSTNFPFRYQSHIVKNTSAIHAPEPEWAELLLRRALGAPVSHDLEGLLKRYRGHGRFYKDRIGAANAWARVPPLEKADLAEIPVDRSTPTREARTSGTSGFQVTIHNNRREREFRRALLYRPQLFYELPESVTQVVFVDGRWCADPETDPKEFTYAGRHYRTWFTGASAEPADIMKLLTTLRPELIRGISSGIVRFIGESSGALDRLGVRIVGPGGEYLPDEWRSLMEDAFGAQVLDRYGSTETGAIAWQCPHCHRYHANTDEIILEADPEGLIATPLFISSQPLLRYRIGDMISFDDRGDDDQSDCPVKLPTVTIEAARRDDWVIDGAGRRISPLSFQFEQVPHLAAWRLHQRGDGSLHLYFDSEQPEIAGRLLVEHLAEAVPDRPAHIIEGIWKLDRPGKFKRVSSDLA